MNSGKSVFIAIFIIAILISLGYAQRFPFRNYNVREGLTQSQVQTIVQDNLGYLWIGTRDGLALFNGRQFQNFTRKDGLDANYIITSYQDSRENIWFSHRTRGLSRLNAQNRQIAPVRLSGKIDSVQIEDMIEDEHGNFWFATRGMGVCKYKNGEYVSYTVENGLLSNNITTIAIREQRELWLGTEQGIVVLDITSEPAGLLKNYTTRQGLSSNNIACLLVDNENCVWAGSDDAGIMRFDSSGIIVKKYNLKSGLSSNVIQTLIQDSKGRIWAGTRGGGISIIEPSQSAPITHLTELHGLSYHDVLSIFEDQEGSFWIGTNGGGICQFRDKRFEFFSLAEGLPDRTVWSIVEDRKGYFWFGTEKGLVRYIRDPHQDELNIRIYGLRQGMVSEEISTLYEDRAGVLWIGLAHRGVQTFNPANNRFGRFIPFEKGDVLAIIQDDNNDMWFGTNGEGLYKYERKKAKLIHYDIRDGLPSNYIFSLLLDKEGDIWIASAMGGVSKFDGSRFSYFSSKDGFEAITVVSMIEDLLGRIWIGTEDYGLYSYDGSKFTNYNVSHGLSGDAAYSLVCDNENNIWQGTRRGIERFDPQTGQAKIYGQYEGFQAVETNQNAVLKDSEGCLWFGTLDGVIKYNPLEDHLNINEPKIHITSVGLYYHDLTEPQSYEFSSGDNHLTFSFIGLSYVAPEKIRYKYILEGLDQQWSPETADNSARYTNLSPGKYKFKVAAMNNDGIWSKAPASFEFEIATPFWKTAWFYLIIVLVIAVAILAEHNRRVNRVEKTNIMLEKRVRERTHELVAEKEKTHDAYRALLDSEEKYKTFITYSTEAIWSVEFSEPIDIALPGSEQIDKFYLHGYVAEGNYAMARLYGYDSVEAMLGLPLDKLLDRNNPGNVEYLQKFIKLEYRLVDEESYEIDQNGHLRILLNSLMGIVEDGKLKRAWGLQRDITDKKHAEDALKESEERYRRLIELSPDAIVVHSEKKIEYINRAGLKLFGALRQKDLVGRSIYSLIHPDYLDEARDKISRIFNEKRPFRNLEQRMLRLDGTIVDVELIGAPMSFQREIAGQIVIRDITERKKAENAVLEEKERLDVTLSSIDDAVITTDIKGFIILLNDRSREILDFDEGEGVGFRFHDVVKITDKDGPINLLEIVLKEKKPVTMVKDMFLETGAGEKYRIEMSAAPIANADGQLIGMVAAIRDITVRKQMEAELTKAQKLESIGVLAGGIAHDFNNFLTAILGNVSLAKMYVQNDSKLSPILSRAEKAIIQAKELTHQLLTFSKGGAPLKKTTSIVDIVQDSANFTLRGSDVFCQVNSPDNLWNVVVDAGQISQVIQNLILNAVQSMTKHKKIQIKIENVELAENEYPSLAVGKYVKIAIIDQGSGIPEKDLNKIFDPYFTTKTKGTGLGLTTTYSIIKRHDGHINILSKLGEGTTVELFLPATEQEVQSEEMPKSFAVQNGKGRILVMDDDLMVRELLDQILTHLGYEVEEAENGEITLEKYKAARSNGKAVDLIIMDLTIPGGMGGKETIKKLLEIDPEVKAIVSSGYSNDPIMASFHEYGFVGVLNKPYNVETLSGALHKYLQNRIHT